MNGLSWLIYLAHASAGVGTVLAWIGGIFMVLAAISTIVALIHLDETDQHNRTLPDDKVNSVRAVRKQANRYAWRFGILGMTAFMIMALTPDRRTVLLIAASEIGERVITSERVIGVVDPSINLLQTWIEQQTVAIRREIDGSRPVQNGNR